MPPRLGGGDEERSTLDMLLARRRRTMGRRAVLLRLSYAPCIDASLGRPLAKEDSGDSLEGDLPEPWPENRLSSDSPDVSEG